MAGAANPAMTSMATNLAANMRAPEGDWSRPTTQSATPISGLSVNPMFSPSPEAPTMPNVYQTSANLYNQAAAGPNIGQFMNPYTSMVTGQTMADLERQRQMQMNTLGQQASAAGAFGGSRHGVAEALTNEGFARQGAQAFGNLQQQGFNTALQAAQVQQGIQSGLAGQGFQFGQQIGQKQGQQGADMTAINQALIDAARGQYGGFTGSPMTALQTMLASVGGANMGQQTQTTTQQPGLFGTLGTLAGILGAL